MPRHPRIHAPGLLYHVMARGNNGQKIFLRERDYRAFLQALGAVRRRYPFYLYAYVLMSNHFHLLLEVIDAPTARIIQSLLTGYVRRFNAVHRRRGHLFQGRYKSIVCDRGLSDMVSDLPKSINFGKRGSCHDILESMERMSE